MSNIFGNWFSSGSFSAWKLHTLWDYIFFFIIVAVGVALIAFAQHRINKNRTADKSSARVVKRMEKLGGEGAKCYCDVVVHTKRDVCPCEMLCVCADCIYAVKVIWWGVDVSGKADGEDWTLTSNKETRYMPNPLPELAACCDTVNRLFARNDMYSINVKPLVILADNFDRPHCHVRGTDSVVAYQDLKKWRKAHPISERKRLDINKVKTVLEGSFAEDTADK